MTALWYKTVLERVNEKARILDIGIGTGTALTKNASLLIDKEIELVGVDYDQSYVTKCKENIAITPGMSGKVHVICKSVYDKDLLQSVNGVSSKGPQELFDAVYFSGSISLMPNPAEALRCTADYLKPNGVIYITQTFQKSTTKLSLLNRLVKFGKPLAKYVTTIDFGQLVFENEVDKFCADSGLETIEKSVIPNSVDNVFQSAFLIVLKKRN